ncbi:FecR family protein [Chitinophaga lutea]|nr:FecR domain-containing protein [Chitinophaga lutea]
MHRSRLIELLAKKKAGEISLQEQFELSKWLQENEDDRELADQLDELFHLDYGPVVTDEDRKGKEKSWDRIVNAIHTESTEEPLVLKKTRIWPWRRLLPLSVASVVLFCVAGWGLYYFMAAPKQGGTSQNIVGTERGSRSSLILPDGSHVWLNSDSRLSYGANFGKNDRVLILTGEAYFDVVKDPDHPLIIRTPTITVKVLGTAFNVRAYPDEKNTTTTLVRGSVLVSVNEKKHLSYTLGPDEKLIVNNDSGLSDNTNNSDTKIDKRPDVVTKIKIVKTDSIPPEAQWIKNKLVFINKPLYEVANILSRWYGVSVIVDGSEEMKAREYTGFFENQNIQSVMESLRLAGGFRYKMENNTILIEP